MKVETILNGTIKFVLIPETDLEKAAIEEFAKTGCDSLLIDKQMQILDNVIHNGIIIKNVSKAG